MTQHVTPTTNTQKGRGLSHQLWSNFKNLSIDAQIAVGITIGAAFAGLIFAFLAPNLPIFRRFARVGVDGFFLFGALAFVCSGEKPEQRKGKWSLFRRVTITFFALVALYLTLVIPHIDPWLKAYRFCLGLVLLAIGIWDIGRIFPRNYLRKNILLAGAFGIIEIATVGYVMVTVDGPIAFAGARSLINNTIAQLEGPGIQVRDIGKTDTGLIYRKNERYFAGDALRDFIHFVNNDPMNAGQTMVNVSLSGETNLLAIIRQDNNAYCRTIKAINPPIDGYAKIDDQIFALDVSMQCATTMLDTNWKKEALKISEINLEKRDQENIKNAKNLNCTKKLERWTQREILDITISIYREKHERSTPNIQWLKSCRHNLPKVKKIY